MSITRCLHSHSLPSLLPHLGEATLAFLVKGPAIFLLSESETTHCFPPISGLSTSHTLPIGHGGNHRRCQAQAACICRGTAWFSLERAHLTQSVQEKYILLPLLTKLVATKSDIPDSRSESQSQPQLAPPQAPTSLCGPHIS